MKSFNYLIIGIASLFLLSCEKTLNKEELRFVHHTLVERMVQEKFCEELPEKIDNYMDAPFTFWLKQKVNHYQYDDYTEMYVQNTIAIVDGILEFLNKRAEEDIYGTIGGINYLNNLYETYDNLSSNYDNFNAEDSMKVYYKEAYSPIIEYFQNTLYMEDSDWVSTIMWGTTGKGDITSVYEDAYKFYCNYDGRLGMNIEYKMIYALVITYAANYLRYNFDYAKVSEKDGRILEYIAPKIDYIYHAYGSIDGNGNTIENDNVWAIGYDNQQAFMVTLINNEDNMRMVSEPIEYDVTLVGEGLDMIN